MTHLHKRSGHTFEVGRLDDIDGNKTYDITVISYWKDADTQDVGSPVELIGYYFGDYNPEDTDFYIDRWFDNRAKEISVLQAGQHYMDAYLTTNEDVLERADIDRLQEALVEGEALLYDRSWRIDFKQPDEDVCIRMNRAEYISWVERTLNDGLITVAIAESLRMLAINYPEE